MPKTNLFEDPNDAYIQKVAAQVRDGMITYQQGATLLRDAGVDEDLIHDVLFAVVTEEISSGSGGVLH